MFEGFLSLVRSTDSLGPHMKALIILLRVTKAEASIGLRMQRGATEVLGAPSLYQLILSFLI